MFVRFLIAVVVSCILGKLLPKPSRALAWFEKRGIEDHFIPLMMTLGIVWVMAVGLWIIL